MFVRLDSCVSGLRQRKNCRSASTACATSGETLQLCELPSAASESVSVSDPTPRQEECKLQRKVHST